MPVTYDPSRQALYHPERRPTLWRPNRVTGDVALAVEAARLAYFDFEQAAGRQDLAAALRLVGYELADWFSQGSSQAYAARQIEAPFRLLLAFRGTEPDEIGDLWDDLGAALRPWGGKGKGQVHTGFQRAYGRLQKRLCEWRATAADRPLLVTGHSLGAALATLATLDLNGTALVTLGCPRVGDAEFARQFEGISATRLVHCCDLVTELPPAVTPFAEYRHVGNAVYIDRHGDIRPEVSAEECESDRGDAKREYLLKQAWRPGNVLLRSLADHAPINYARAYYRD